MALTSPRFAADPVLQKAATNTAPLAKGARGHAVHLVQMALLELGHKMPRSTGRDYSPDGIFGDETQAVVKQFQRDNKLKDDGIIGKLTMGALDAKFPRHTHRVRLHFRSLALTRVPFARILADIERVFGQYGIRIVMANGESLGLSEEEAKKFDQIDQECNWDLDDGEFNELHGLGTPAPQNDILVYYIQKFKEANLLGCGGHATKRPAVTVAATANRWDTAHEVGHVLLGSGFTPVHAGDVRNLMFATSSTSNNVPGLNEKQLAQMRSNICCQAI